MPPVPPRRREALPQGREVLHRQVRDRAPQLPARPARPEVRPRRLGLRHAAAREAEGAPHLRRARAPVPQVSTPRPTRRKGITGENLLQLLESRLDTVVYRMGFGATRAEARQVVRHNGDPRERQAREHPVVRRAARRHDRGRARRRRRSCASRPPPRPPRARLPEWVEVDAKELKGTFKARAAALRVAVRTSTRAGGRAVLEVIARER